MPRIPQGHAVKGSQKWIQKLVNEKPDLLSSLIETQLDLPETDTIAWLSPLAEDGYAEYREIPFPYMPRILSFWKNHLIVTSGFISYIQQA